MLSRLASKSAAGAQLRIPAILARASTTEVQAGERDEKNFPRPVRLETCPKVRFGFLPDDWFLFFHKKTGVTGPYLFGLGVTNYLVSKEWYILEHEYYTGVSILVMVMYATIVMGPKIGEFVNKKMDEENAEWTKNRIAEIQGHKDGVDNAEKEMWRADGQELLIEAKKENVLLQLEAVYRERLLLAYASVKQRLDYQLEKQNIERRIAQKEMVDWIVENVLKSITPDQEKATINKCIGDLAALASKSK